MNINNYIPKPIDTSDVKLPDELTPLVEQIAHNVHEVWADSRMKEGWTFGTARNDTLKTHPCLVPYDELPEEEKDYDRNTARSTLLLAMKLGFNISAQKADSAQQPLPPNGHAATPPPPHSSTRIVNAQNVPLSSYLPLAIVATVVFTPLGIVSLIYALKAIRRKRQGLHDLAAHCRRKSKSFAIFAIAIAAGILLTIACLVFSGILKGFIYYGTQHF